MRETVYISGKITGCEDLNKPKFAAAESLLRRGGLNVINPHDLPDGHHDKSWEAYMKECLIHMIDEAAYVFVLDDWKKSRGAIREVMTAKWLKIPVYSIETFEEVSIPLLVKIKLLLNLI